MGQTQYLSTDPNWGAASSTPEAPPEDPKTQHIGPAQGGYWEDKGVAGKEWHPANGAGERTRVDNSLLGMPPELAAISALSLGRAVLRPGLSVAQRAISGAKNVAMQAGPVVKYEATRTILEKLGIPAPLAIPAAMAVSGYKRGGGAAANSGVAAAESEATAATRGATPPATSRVASPPAAPVQSAPPPVAQAAEAVEAEAHVVQSLMEQGGMSQSEAHQAVKWMKDGAPSQLVWKRIQDARKLATKGPFSKLPTNADVEASVADRNVKGRWPQDKQ